MTGQGHLGQLGQVRVGSVCIFYFVGWTLRLGLN